MKSKTMNTNNAGPLWAVFGAPLVGVPLMVGLLALGSRSAVDTTVDPDVGLSVEQVDTPNNDTVADQAALPGD